MRIVILFAVLTLLAGRAMATSTPTTGIVVAGAMDSQPFTCRASTNVEIHYNAKQGSLETSFLCQGAIPVDCLAAAWTYTYLSVSTDCYTPPPTGAFAVVHLPQLATISPGTSGTLLVQVYNSTGKSMTSVTVSASAAPACAHAATSLGAGQVLSYTCATPVLQADITDTLTVTATSSTGAHYSGSAASIVQVDGPRIALNVTPSAQNVVLGNSADWNVTVANAGPTSLTSWLIDDQHAGSNCGQSLSSLVSGSGLSYTCDVLDIQSSFSDQFSASGMNGTSPLVVDKTVTVNAVTDEIFKNGFQ